MISKIINRAACLRELASNPKSFSNCPDLHGGVPDLPEVTSSKTKALHRRFRLPSNTCTSTIRFRKFRGTEYRALGQDSRFESSFANSDPRLLSKKFLSPSCITAQSGYAFPGGCR